MPTFPKIKKHNIYIQHEDLHISYNYSMHLTFMYTCVSTGALVSKEWEDNENIYQSEIKALILLLQDLVLRKCPDRNVN